MSKNLPNHLSNKLEIDYTKGGAYLTDKVRLKSLLPTIIFGFLLALLGVYEWFNAFEFGAKELIPHDDDVVYKSSFAVWFFDLCFILSRRPSGLR